MPVAISLETGKVKNSSDYIYFSLYLQHISALRSRLDVVGDILVLRCFESLGGHHLPSI